MPKNKYWRERFKKEEARMNALTEIEVRRAAKEYEKSFREIEKDINNWYSRIAKNNDISYADAEKLLSKKELEEFKWTVGEYIKRGRENNLTGEWMKQLENASAKYHIERLEAMKLQISNQVEQLYNKRQYDMENFLKNTFKDSYYHSAFNIAQGTGVGKKMYALNSNLVDKVINKPWMADGKNFSDRLWQDKENLINTLHTELTQSFIRGDTQDKVIKRFMEKFDTKKHVAARLIRTESAAYQSKGRLQCYGDLDVEKYEIISTLDIKTSHICRDLDGTIFDAKDYEIGVTANPFHPFCRSTTAPYFDDAEDDVRAARDSNGKTNYVPGDMKYNDWFNKYVESNLESDAGNGIINTKDNYISELKKLKNSGMSETQYNEYLSIINNNKNLSLKQIYSKYGDSIDIIKETVSGGEYSSFKNMIDFSYPKYNDINKYSTLAHEYGHFFNEKINFNGLHFKEMNMLREVTGLKSTFANIASSSDEFLNAIRQDRVHLKSLFTSNVKSDFIKNNASHSVQDAIDGLFSKSRIIWGHGEKYYNRVYAGIEHRDKISGTSLKKKLQQAYKSLGFDVGSQNKVKMICRNYEAASEIFAHVISAETCGGETLEYVKKYLPNSYETIIEMLKEVK